VLAERDNIYLSLDFFYPFSILNSSNNLTSSDIHPSIFHPTNMSYKAPLKHFIDEPKELYYPFNASQNAISSK